MNVERQALVSAARALAPTYQRPDGVTGVGEVLLACADQIERDGRSAANAEIARLREVIDAYENPTDEWCYEENCRYRHWRSGNMPTHMRGRECPSAKVTATAEEGK